MGQQAKTKMEKVYKCRSLKNRESSTRQRQAAAGVKKKPPPKGGCVRYTVINYTSLII